MPAVAERAVGVSQQQQDGFAADEGEILFKHTTPRKRYDRFGRTSTRPGDCLLSMAVFPTAIRTPLLLDLQQKGRYQCGFEVTDKGTYSQKHVYILDSGRHQDNSPHGSASEGAKKPPPNTPLTESKVSSERGTRAFLSIPPSSRKYSVLQGYRWVKSTDPRSRCSLGTSRDGQQNDIRDPLYLNTYCPGERKLRYKKMSSSLPRISSRNRPWTVSEANSAYRFARSSIHVISSQERSHGKSVLPRHVNFRIDESDVTAPPKGHSAVHASTEAPEEDEDVYSSQALLEVRAYIPHEEGEQPLTDQRDALRGKEGCLHSRVKQCIKFVKYRDRMAKKVERPMKQEHGKYRPFSTTRVRTPNVIPADSPRPLRPDTKSVDTYKEYMDTIAMQTRLVSAVHQTWKTRQPVSGLPRYNTATSYYHNYDSRTLQSIADSNRPTGSSTDTTASATINRQSERSNPASLPTSAGTAAEKAGTGGGSGGVDQHGVHQALGIIRLSPKASPSRPAEARGSRPHPGNVEEEEARTEWDKEEGGSETKTHAIFLPNASKSATTSVCSFSRDLDDDVAD